MVTQLKKGCRRVALATGQWSLGVAASLRSAILALLTRFVRSCFD